MMRFLQWIFGRTDDAKRRVPEPEELPPINWRSEPAALARPAAPPISRSKNYVPPARRYRFIALDVETANDDPGSICQIGIATVDQDNRLATFSTLINPQTFFRQFNTDLHGIDSDKVRHAPTFEMVIASLAPILAQQPIISHSNFDPRAIRAAAERYGLDLPEFKWIDSVKLAQNAWPEFRGNGGHGLAHLKKQFGIVFTHHDAGEDARAAAEVTLLAEQATGRAFDVPRPRKKIRKDFPPPVSIEGNPTGAHADTVVVFTGSLTLTRIDAAQMAADCGMTVKNTVTLKTTLLVVGDQDLTVLAGHPKSSKHRKAEEMLAAGRTIRIITETEFLSLTKVP